jgi:hypothetical protein
MENEMGEQIQDTKTIKVATVTQATFIETCASGLQELSKTGVSVTAAVHLQSIGQMLKQCAQSLRSFAGSYAPSVVPEEPSETPKHPDEALPLHDEQYLEEEGERRLAEAFGLIGGGDDGQDGMAEA